MMRKVSELKPGDKIHEVTENGRETFFEVVSVQALGRRIEVTFRSAMGLASAIYPASAYIPAA